MTPKQERFVEEYLKDLNATQAAIRAGYSESTAKKQASRLLVNVGVSEKISERKEELLQKVKMDQLSTVRDLLRCAHYDVRKLFDEFGNLKEIKDIDDDTAAAIESIEFIKRKKKDDEGYENGIKIKLVGKLKSLELIGKYQDLFKDINDATLKGNCGVVRMGAEDHNVYLPKKVPIGAPVPHHEND
ncbi:terminase small subunit [Candidatus Latescibacterota bacterium]